MTIYHLLSRNLRLFFRDRMSVFFSLLSVIIIIGLYVLFLGDVISQSLVDMGDNVRFMIDSWIMAGLLAVTSMSGTLGALGIMVEDNAKKTGKDFMASPVKRSTLAAGYAFNAIIVGVILCAITLLLAEAYILIYGGKLMGAGTLLKVFGLLILSVFSSSSMVFLIATFLKSVNAFGTVSTIVGTLIGFLTGIYIPIGNLPAGVQMIIKVFPVSHAGALFRQIMMEEPMALVFAGAPADMVESFKIEMGIVFQIGEHTVTSMESVLILIATTLVFYGLAILNLSRKRK